MTHCLFQGVTKFFKIHLLLNNIFSSIILCSTLILASKPYTYIGTVLLVHNAIGTTKIKRNPNNTEWITYKKNVLEHEGSKDTDTLSNQKFKVILNDSSSFFFYSSENY